MVALRACAGRASPRRAVSVRGLLVLAVGSLLAVAWAAGADSRPEDQVLTPPREPEHSPDWAEGHAAARGSAGVPAGSADQREEPPTQAEGPAGRGDITAQALLGQLRALSPAGPWVNSSSPEGGSEDATTTLRTTTTTACSAGKCPPIPSFKPQLASCLLFWKSTSAAAIALSPVTTFHDPQPNPHRAPLAPCHGRRRYALLLK